ncbi:MAG TPA: hypothetical protein VF173_26060 [Thermoanaerobaculia bacterium]|nr:hypothetical protein [Thermoanaerobaculia bacterium]
MRRSCLLTPAWLAWALLALGPAGFAREVPVRLVAPRAGAALIAGATAELEWAPLPAFSRLQGTEEWEAFLSVDGGASYPVRITPHLDQDLRRIRFQVPLLPTADARILLRFGDERQETAVELPERFAIAAAKLPVLADVPARRAVAAGEPALPGRAGVVAWVEGSRRGGSLRQVVAAERPGLAPRPDLNRASPGVALFVPGPPPPQPQDSLQGEGVAVDSPARRGAAAARAAAVPPLASDILLLTQRQNE